MLILNNLSYYFQFEWYNIKLFAKKNGFFFFFFLDD